MLLNAQEGRDGQRAKSSAPASASTLATENQMSIGEDRTDAPPSGSGGAALRPIRLVLLRLVMGVLTPLLLLIAGYGAWNIQLQREEVNRNLRDSARAVSLHVSQDVAAIQAALRALALSPYLKAGDFAAFHDEAIKAAAPFNGWIVVGDRSFKQIVNTLVPFGTALPEMSVQQVSRRTLTQGVPSVSGLFSGAVAKRAVVAVSVPVFVDGVPSYELRMAFLPERFSPLLSNLDKQAGWISLLYDADYQIIAQSPDKETFGRALANKMRSALEENAHGRQDGTFDGIDIDGREYVTSYTRSEVTGWLTAVAAPESLVNNPISRATLILAVGGLISLCLAILSALIMGRRIALPLQALAQQADGIVRGEGLPPVCGEPVQEVADVREALGRASDMYRRQMATRLSLEREKRARELAEYSRAESEKRERKTRRLIEANLIGVIIVEDECVVEANAVFLRMMGWQPDDLQAGRISLSSIASPGAPLLDEDAIRRLHDQGALAPMESELQRQDGSRVSVLLGAARVESETPSLRWVCFVVDLTQLKQAAFDLKRSEERYRGLVEAISSIVWIADANGAIVDMQHWSEMTGQSAEQCRGRGWLDVLHPEDRRPTLATWSFAIDNRMPLDIEYRVRNRNGRYRWYHARGAPVLDGDGSVREWVGVCFDIDERKAAATRQLLLMAELDHRVRNILATIQSMISLTGNTAESKDEYAAVLLGRITAMARTHGLLSRETWHGATLMQIVSDEAAPYLAEPPAIHIEGDRDFCLRPKDALDFALVIHELMTNAAKYGALSVLGGQVFISWRIDTESGQLVFTWQECCGPNVTTPGRRGFGRRLIESVFSAGLGRSADLQFLPAGLSCTLTMPIGVVDAQNHAAPSTDGIAKVRTNTASMNAMLAGRILIVEDEPLIAMELHRLVTNAGLEVSGPAGTLDQALHLASDQTLTGAILDINLGGETSYPIADRLRNRSVPFIFVSGYIAESAPERFASCTILQKPVEPRALMSVLRQQLSNSPEIQNRAEPPSHCTQRR